MTGILGGLIASLGVKKWFRQVLGASSFHQRVAYAPLANGKYFMLRTTSTGINSNTYWYSLNGETWTSGTFPTTINRRGLVANNSRIIALGSATPNHYSDNGTTWTAFTASAIGNFSDGVWTGTRFVVSGTSTGLNIAHSTDGITWSSYDHGPAADGLGWNGAQTFITVVGGSTNGRINTTDITSSAAWSNISLPQGAINWTTVNWNGSIWVIAGDGTTTYGTSPNGTTWTTRTLPAIMSGGAAGLRTKMTVLEGKFYYVNSQNTDTTARIYTSADGITWTIESTLSISGTSGRSATGWATGEGKTIVSLGTPAGNSVDDYFILK